MDLVCVSLGVLDVWVWYVSVLVYIWVPANRPLPWVAPWLEPGERYHSEPGSPVGHHEQSIIGGCGVVLEVLRGTVSSTGKFDAAGGPLARGRMGEVVGAPLTLQRFDSIFVETIMSGRLYTVTLRVIGARC